MPSIRNRLLKERGLLLQDLQPARSNRTANVRLRTGRNCVRRRLLPFRHALRQRFMPTSDGDRDTNRYAHSDEHGHTNQHDDRDRNRDTNGHRDEHCDRDSNGDADGYRDEHRHRNSDGHRDEHRHGDAHGDQHADAFVSDRDRRGIA
jgi:hypothetical protein